MVKAFVSIISLLLCITGQSEAASPQDKYIETRDEFIRQSSTASSPEANYEKTLSKLKRALSKLEKQASADNSPH
jgi:hypothetical protein